MIVLRRRLIYWLIKEYLKKWGKNIILCFVVGLLFFFLLRFFLYHYATRIPMGRKETIGMVGSYTLETLPQSIIYHISRGLTTISKDGTPLPDVAYAWKIEENGGKYIFYIRRNLYFTDGTPMITRALEYNFSEAKVEKPDFYTIVFTLKDSYSPFLVTVSRPIIKKGYIGLGPYKIKDIKFNGNFIQTLTLVSANDQYNMKAYRFYPTHEALKTAFVLGEVSKAVGLPDVSLNSDSFDRFKNATVNRKVNYQQLVTLFYNTKDSVVSDNKIRSALSYALPDNFPNLGERAYAPFHPKYWAYTSDYLRIRDSEHSTLLLQTSSASESAGLVFEIKTLPKYKMAADIISDSWKEIGIHTKIEEVESIPSKYQIFLGDYTVPRDPDQYSLWHKDQENNITKYDNQRIDKLLEDGRKTVDREARKKIYTDFQKYLLVDSPASFLYFPYEYEVSRK